MVGIRGVGAGAATRAGRGTRGAGGGFRLGPGAEASEPAAAQAAAAPSAIGLLALQETAPAAERDARARRRGEAMLGELAALQVELLSGRVDPARLQALAALAEGEAAADPMLAESIAAISLRARIELARRGIG
ncbi:flagellar assembly regulator FliX [Roseomonas eburnea]|uniref:Flagellar assembly regulator FliX n=1 Tax=Neoroseomonas eburnea TaxID=1346889 RepID=A0A9X9XAL9_9PROT|nr:flagellar assembly protein FliX [Neoroseomonas eburnea]MBR0680755.1 flagellar assembly regulator FliX [Neoroseomonas eburnea]